jgi:mannitol-specific phosphotransferase system IIBC component
MTDHTVASHRQNVMVAVAVIVTGVFGAVIFSITNAGTGADISPTNHTTIDSIVTQQPTQNDDRR